jgi:uncharacterized membrane protein
MHDWLKFYNMLASPELAFIYSMTFLIKTRMAEDKSKPRTLHLEIRDRPDDLIACVALALILVALILFAPDNILRQILGLIFVLFLPGYAATAALFPENDQIDGIERIALSFGLSIAIVPLIGLALNFTPWGIRLDPILASVSGFIIIASLVGWYRRNRLPKDERFAIVIDVKVDFAGMPLVDKALTIGIVVMLVASVVVLGWAIATPRTGERFTQLAILGPGGMATDYPRNMTVGETKTVLLSVESLEHVTMDYSIVIVLTNQSDSSFQVGDGTIDWNGMHALTPRIGIEQNFTINHREYYNQTLNFTVSSPGEWKMQFLLYTQGQALDQNAYREVHLWLNVT